MKSTFVNYLWKEHQFINNYQDDKANQCIQSTLQQINALDHHSIAYKSRKVATSKITNYDVSLG
jgi:hypothetical protein